MADQVLSRTLNQKFDTVFEEVTHQETLNLLNRNDLKLFCLDIETNQFNYDPLVEFLEDNLGMYVFSRAELDELVDAGKDRTVALKAVRRLIKTGNPGEKGTGSELGEILDYCFFEHVLEAPKILSKYEQVTAGGTYKARSEGVHLLSVGKAGAPAYQLVYGASGIIDDIQDSSYKNSAHAVWQFVHDIKPGDVIFAKRGRSEILGRGVVESDYEYDDNHDGEYPNIRKVKWTHKGSWQSDEMFAMKTLTDVTNYTDFTNKISGFFEDGNEDEEEDTKVIDYPAYSVEDFLNEVYMDEESYYKLVGVLDSKLNIILQGAPGVGKTFVAKRLAYSIMGVKDVDRVMMVQFHQSYSYEDFIMGFRPSADGFDIKTGAFYNFCKKAEGDGDNKYFFIIDEINRGNLSKIFGELFMLIENDKRGSKNKLQLLYRDEMFYVPENVYIIGMMNTADRSLAMLDYALRRRFAFFDLKPGFTTEGFRAYRDSLDNKKFEALVGCVQSLNEKITADESLGEGFCIGHSYFCNMELDEVTDEKLQSIVEYELIPMLKEYWFDEPLKVKEWSDNLRSAVK